MENSNGEAESNSTAINNGSCSACKHQRKQCKPDCILRKHFPATKPDEFKNVQKIFGIANITKKIRGANNSIEAERGIVESLYWEGDAWAKDPIYGPYGLMKGLEQKLKAQEQELNDAKSKLHMMQACFVPNANANMNMMNVNNIPNNIDLFLNMDGYPSSYARNGFQQRFLQRGNNNGDNNGVVNNQGIMENVNWRELHRNGIQPWGEQGLGRNFGPSPYGHAPFVSESDSNFVSETDRNRANATKQEFGYEKPN